MRYLWRVIDSILVELYGIRPLLVEGDGILAVEHCRYAGIELELGDGSRVRKGDMVLRLHLQGRWFLRRCKKEPMEVIVEGLRCVKEELAVLAEYIDSGKQEEAIALCCSTFFYDLLKRLGFEVRESNGGLGKRLSAFYMSRLRESYYPRESSGSRRKDAILDIKQGWISRFRLMQLYGQLKS